ncbi:MAG TPA: aminotransferase class I/II-fold pyridoxal phosphate-dependent enzyme [Chryseosolibacter sp.]
MARFPRRKFLKSAGFGLFPAVIPFSAKANRSTSSRSPLNGRSVRFTSDGEIFEPAEYLAELQSVNERTPIVRDRYAQGGAVAALERAFVEKTGKEKAIYMPTGTMANELAISVLSGDNAKVFVQDTSHVYRDEADAAQRIFGKRLIGLAPGKTYFTLDELKAANENLAIDEHIPGKVGAVSIENPNRRMNGTVVPIEEIQRISGYCRHQNIPLHLDGARIFIASAYTGVDVRTYASYFDTVYISLYKYLGASGGAVLCGPAAIIDQMPLLIKIHGGLIAGNWLNAAMALHRLEGFEKRMKRAIETSQELFAALNATQKLKISPIAGGSNIHKLELDKRIDPMTLRDKLFEEFTIRIPPPNEKKELYLYVNETLLNQPIEYLLTAFRKCCGA